jgi:hypothetical protein
MPRSTFSVCDNSTKGAEAINIKMAKVLLMFII